MNGPLEPTPLRDAEEARALDRALAALPRPAPDPASAERIRLRARAELAAYRRRDPTRGWWYRAEPYVTAAVVIAFLGWTAVKVAAVLS